MAKVTRDDVARLAGTSTAVVSYVINNGPRPVAPATRERVLAAIKQLGYRPDRVAQAMASRRTDLIGMIVPDARQPFVGEMARAVEQAAGGRGKRERTALHGVQATARQELARAKAAERTSPRADKTAARQARKDAEQRVRLAERAVHKAERD